MTASAMKNHEVSPAQPRLTRSRQFVPGPQCSAAPPPASPAPAAEELAEPEEAGAA